MKEKGLPTWAAAVIAMVLVIAAFGIGAVRGWSSNRSAALEHADIAVSADILSMDAANMKVVALRHLDAKDPLILALDADMAVLKNGGSSAEDKVMAAEQIRGTAEELRTGLSAMESVQNDPRDKAYIDRLTADLTEGNGVKSTYNNVASAFNGRMEKNLMGKLAMLLGVRLLPVY